MYIDIEQKETENQLLVGGQNGWFGGKIVEGGRVKKGRKQSHKILSQQYGLILF